MPLVFGQDDVWQTMLPMAAVIGAVIVLFILLIIVAVFANYFRLWIQSFLTGAGITIFDLIGMTFRKVNKDVIVKSKIMAVQAGLDEDQGMTSKALEAHYLAGGNVPLVVRSLIAANKAKIIRLSFREATAIDLAGRNILEAVQTSVYPKVIDCPARGQYLEAIAQNGIQLKVRARVTVRANLQRLI
ncbi:MAG: flotillin-like FloA family protein, partial [Planctomycetaceae bacterium]|nr:flotillin-like FloA family protein [Planctomycetaceae bacterium]